MESLARLELLLTHLPDTLPDPAPELSSYPFISFELDQDLYEKIEDEVGTLNEQFKRAFGWKSRTTGDGILPITERGESICAVVDVLSKYLEKHPGNAILEKWTDDIIEGAKKIYQLAGKEVSSQQLRSLRKSY